MLKFISKLFKRTEKNPTKKSFAELTKGDPNLCKIFVNDDDPIKDSPSSFQPFTTDLNDDPYNSSNPLVLVVEGEFGPAIGWMRQSEFQERYGKCVQN